MGFRSMFITEDCAFLWPEWFREKWGPLVHIPDRGALASRAEAKVYMTWEELAPDIRRALKENKYGYFPLRLLWFHECGGITKMDVGIDETRYAEPSRWGAVDGVTHWHCHGCSTPPAYLGTDPNNCPDPIFHGIGTLAELPHQQRLAIIGAFCRRCGGKYPACTCPSHREGK